MGGHSLTSAVSAPKFCKVMHKMSIKNKKYKKTINFGCNSSLYEVNKVYFIEVTVQARFIQIRR